MTLSWAVLRADRWVGCVNEDPGDAGWDGPGWYFGDETGGLHGPFISKELAEKKWAAYDPHTCGEKETELEHLTRTVDAISELIGLAGDGTPLGRVKWLLNKAGELQSRLSLERASKDKKLSDTEALLRSTEDMRNIAVRAVDDLRDALGICHAAMSRPEFIPTEKGVRTFSQYFAPELEIAAKELHLPKDKMALAEASKATEGPGPEGAYCSPDPRTHSVAWYATEVEYQTKILKAAREVLVNRGKLDGDPSQIPQQIEQIFDMWAEDIECPRCGRALRL